MSSACSTRGTTGPHAIRGNGRWRSTKAACVSAVYGHDQRWHLVSSTLPLPQGWHHAVGTFDGRQVRLYLNGSMQRQNNGQSSGQFRGYINRPREAKPPSAGSNAPLGHYGFDGAIARVRLLDQAMADEEIREAYRTACELVPAVARRAEDGCGVVNE